MNKKTLDVLLAVLLTAPAIAFGRIGETRKQCDARYGAQPKCVGDVWYHKDDLLIIVSFGPVSGKAWSVNYSVEGGDVADKSKANGLTQKDVEALLLLNGRGKKWEGPSTNLNNEVGWNTEDGKITASWRPGRRGGLWIIDYELSPPPTPAKSLGIQKKS